jgi:hypothetical protein
VAAEITADGTVAAARTEAGVDVVLLLAPGVSLGRGRGGPGRVAVFVMDGARPDELDLAWASSMGAELFAAPSSCPLPSTEGGHDADRRHQEPRQGDG